MPDTNHAQIPEQFPGAPAGTQAAPPPSAAAEGASGDGLSDGRLVAKERDLLRFTTAGSVDDGKSTLIGRMLFDSKQIFQDQMDQLETASKLRGEEGVNLALLTDGLRAEREQGITIDVAYRYFSTSKRKFIIADTPGHEQYTRNMVTGASNADLAIVLIDARKGVLTQSRRHGIIASLLGIQHIVVAVNKMDLVGYSEQRFNEIVEEYSDFTQKLNVHDISFIPISALEGDNVVDSSVNMPWYDGRTLLHVLETVTISADRNLVDFRFPVQYVVRPHQNFRGFSGRIPSGTIAIGEEVTALPSLRRSKVQSIHLYDQEVSEAFAGQSVVITLEDEIDISRGDMIVRSHNLPEVSGELEAVICWMDERKTLSAEAPYILQHTTRTCTAYVEKILYRMDVNTLHRGETKELELNEIGRVRLTTSQPIFYDPYDRNRETGGFILIDPSDFRTVGAGMLRYTSSETLRETRRERARAAGLAGAAGSGGVIPSGVPTSTVDEPMINTGATNVVWDHGLVPREEREARNGHPALCVWLTGLSGSGKSAIAREVERRLFAEGVHVIRLDGDNLRHGLCADLGFSADDRRDNVRRAGHAARLLFESGQVVLCSLISPYIAERDYVREQFPGEQFLEVFVKCDIEQCRERDPKGLYKRADAGEIIGFTGVDDPYEEPASPELVIDTTVAALNDSVDRLLTAVQQRLGR